VAPGSDTGNSANCSGAGSVLTNVGAYSLSESPYGTYDQGGNVWEWNEEAVGGLGFSFSRGLRGGGLGNDGVYLATSKWISSGAMSEASEIGFRVASPIPEPGTGLLVMTGLAGLAVSRRRSAQAL
jgi:formylglycine-generating enzyme required for sulfatase activity